MDRARILVVDDDTDVLLALSLLLKENGYQVVTETVPRNVPALMRKAAFDAVFLDMNFSREARDGEEGLAWLRKIRELDPDAMVIPITAFGDIELAVRAVRGGAADFILKPWENEKLLGTLSMALRLKASILEVRQLHAQQRLIVSDMDSSRGEMIGESAAMRGVASLVAKVAGTDANVLILGENGTGKELVARALHRLSGRSGAAFIGVDMAAVSEGLFESELFGHAKGSFTGAGEDRIGRFEAASGGTFFLDEIGNLSLTMQAKILRALEDREVMPVGSNKPRPIDIRLISATNAPIYDMVVRREFRQDLLYRINTIEIPLPPLRERREDIPPLVEHFSAACYRKYKIAPKKMPIETILRLQDYSWPGNIRELKHAIERAIIISDSSELAPENFFLGGRAAGDADPVRGAMELEALERQAIRDSLRRSAGNISRAAEELGITRASLYRRMAKYGLQQPQD